MTISPCPSSGPRRPVLVTGASGAVGPALVAKLRDTGHEVRVYSRHASRQEWPAGVHAYDGDIGDPDRLRSAAENVGVIFHLASMLHVLDDRPALAEEYSRVNIGGTQNVARAAAACGAERIVLFSTIAVYGGTQGREVDEHAPTSTETEYARSKLAAEAELMRAEPDRSTILRVAAVYGPRLKGNYLRLLRAMARRRFVPLGSGQNRRTLVFDRDVADAAIAVAWSSNARGRIYNVTDGHVHVMRDIIDAIARALGQRAPSFYVPTAAARVGISLLGGTAALFGMRLQVNAATVDKYVEDVAVRGDRITTDTGWSPRVHLQDGWLEVVTSMRQSGVL